MSPSRQSLAVLAAACIPLCLTDRLTAQIPIGGNQSGTLAAGIYVANASITVPIGQTLILAPGVIIKWTSAGHQFQVNGTLLSNGNAANPVILTAYADDSAGGDTNGNGPSSGAPIAWQGMVFASTASASVLSYTDVRYGGGAYVSNIVLNSANPTLTNCTIRNNYTNGMQLNGNSFPTVQGCTFTGNGGHAIDGVSVMALPGFQNNTASGNATNIARVSVGAVTSNLTISPSAMISGAICIDTTITVPLGVTLTFAPGVTCKLMNAGCQVTVNGTLITNGTAPNPVVFTAFADDSAGGDTNGNGPSSGAPIAWQGMVFNSTASSSTLNYADVRYGGANYVSNIELNTANPTLSHCVIRNNYTHGMDLNGNSRPTVTNCTFTGNGSNAIEGVPINALAGFTNNTASGNALNIARVTVGTVTGSLAVGPAAMLGGALTFDVSIAVPAGATLTLAAGTICKLMSAGISVGVDGTLSTNGTAQGPVIFTSFTDDSAGGDTNNNGASSGAPIGWQGIVFSSTAGASTLNYADVRYGGGNYVSNIELNAASPTLSHCVIRNNYTHGMDLNGNSFPTVTNCAFTNNGGLAVEGVALAAVPGFTNNTAAGNAGNYQHITSANVTTALRVGPQSILQGALVMGSSIVVAPTGALTVEQGVNLKFEGGHTVTVDGALRLLGTSYEPIAFTGITDDSVAGDTNNNGPSNGSAASWGGITINATAGASRLENVVIRYTGGNFVPALTSASPNVALRSVRVDGAYDRGFVLGALAGNPANLVAHGCGGIGIQLTGGSFHLVHATCAANSTGIRREAGWTGSVINSISYGNSTNFANFGTGSQVLRSNGGFAGSNGNLNVDPLFVGQPTGDLHLGLASPCLGAADILQALLTQKDHDENSRILDHALVGAPAADMGAFERPAWDVAVAGTARPGSTVTFTVTGPPGDSFIALGVLDGASPFFPWGMLLAGASPGTSVALLYPVTIPVGFPIPLPLVNDPQLLGIAAGIQTLTFPAGNMAVGNFTRLYRMLIRP